MLKFRDWAADIEGPKTARERQRIGDIYINRNMIGAVVGCGSDYSHEDTER